MWGGRKRRVGILLLAGIMCLIGPYAMADEFNRKASNGQIVRLKTPDNVPFAIWGTKVTYPAPTLLIFSATIEESLGDPYYRQCGNALAEHGFLCVSMDLPGHGADHRDGEPKNLAAWRYRSDQGEDFVAPFTAAARKVLDHLIASGHTDPAKIAACGTSRGGFMAMQMAAVEPRIRATAAFAPVTNLMALREFDGATNVKHVAGLSLHERAKQLAGRSLWLIIGDRDARVGTDDCIAFARRVTTLSLEASERADVTLIVQPEPKGHTSPEGAPEKAAAWILDKLK
jgi:dienelactone hydrolase